MTSALAAYTPKLVSVLREGYRLPHLRRDAIAGLTVAIVALPLSMAIAIASGVTPAQGLTTAIIGGFLVSAFGGSRFQIGGPAGAFIVLVSTTVATHGLDGLILATFLSGLFLIAVGLLRLGSFVRLIPHPVTLGFTAGIAVIIFASQIKDLLGLAPATDPAALANRIPALWQARDTLTPAAVALSAGTILTILVLRRLRPHWPALLIAVAAAALFAALAHLPVATIGSAFGGIPSTLPMPHLPALSPDRIVAVLPAALAFTLLGSIESLLSAVVADSMTGRRHRSNCELVAQGIANMGSALCGGFCVTGTIARTATNVRAGAHSPVAGMLHAVFLLAFMLIAAPLAGYIPLAALAGVLAVVAWNMVERHAIAPLLRAGGGEAAVLAVTFLLTIFRDLTEAIAIGTGLAALLVLWRIGRSIAVTGGDNAPPVCRVAGPLVFSATGALDRLLDTMPDAPRALILDLSAVPVIDSTGAATLATLAHRTDRRGGQLWITGAPPHLDRILTAYGLRPPLCRQAETVESALDQIAKLASDRA